MKRAEFIKTISETLGVEAKTVNVIARFLREAGHLTTGSRGVNAPHHTSRDAAATCLALMTGEAPTKVVSEFERYRAYTVDQRWSEAHSELLNALGFKANMTLLDAMELGFAAFKDKTVFDPFLVKFLNKDCLPRFSFTLAESSRSVFFKDGYGNTICFDDMPTAKKTDDFLLHHAIAQGKIDWEKLSKLMDEETEIDNFLREPPKGMRVRREVTVAEFQTIGTALCSHCGSEEKPNKIISMSLDRRG